MSTPTTTHGDWGSGDPHLRVTRDGERSIFPLTADVTHIGSAAGSELVLEGAEPVHATITHDERDEYVLTLHGDGETNAASLSADGERMQILRTGASFTVGEWELVFGREEGSDHGRPYGGRAGGELDDQPLQPPRPDYTGDDAQTDDGTADRSSTTRKLGGDEQGATAPDTAGESEEPWS